MGEAPMQTHRTLPFSTCTLRPAGLAKLAVQHLPYPYWPVFLQLKQKDRAGVASAGQ